MGDAIDVVLWRDESERTVDVPPLFEKAMKREGIFPFFERLSYTHRKEYCNWICGAKKEETQMKRLKKAIALLKLGVKTPG